MLQIDPGINHDYELTEVGAEGWELVLMNPLIDPNFTWPTMMYTFKKQM